MERFQSRHDHVVNRAVGMTVTSGIARAAPTGGFGEVRSTPSRFLSPDPIRHLGLQHVPRAPRASQAKGRLGGGRDLLTVSRLRIQRREHTMRNART